MAYGYGDYQYEVQEGWFQPPEGYSFGWVPAVACDSLDRVYVYSARNTRWWSLIGTAIF